MPVDRAILRWLRGAGASCNGVAGCFVGEGQRLPIFRGEGGGLPSISRSPCHPLTPSLLVFGLSPPELPGRLPARHRAIPLDNVVSAALATGDRQARGLGGGIDVERTAGRGVVEAGAGTVELAVAQHDPHQ